MIYYDIHTHKPSFHQDEIAIVNRIIGSDPEKDPAPFQSVGIHPWYIYNVCEQMELLRQTALLPQTIAIGEAGLDKLAATSLELQQELFHLQAVLSEEVEKPLIIHCVKAWTELIALKKQMNPNMPWIIHGFRGNKTVADQLLRQGFYLSYGTYYNPEAVKAAWPDHLFAETDDKNVGIRIVYRQIATSLQIEPEIVALQIGKNVKRVFGI